MTCPRNGSSFGDASSRWSSPCSWAPRRSCCGPAGMRLRSARLPSTKRLGLRRARTTTSPGSRAASTIRASGRRWNGSPSLDEAVVVAGDTLWLRKTEGRRRPGGGRADEPVRVPDRRVRRARRATTPRSSGASVRDRIVRALDARAARCSASTARGSVASAPAERSRSGRARSGSVPSSPTTRSAGRRCSSTARWVAGSGSPTSATCWRSRVVTSPGRPGSGCCCRSSVRIRSGSTSPGGTRYVRVASGVNPPILVKQAFGEFAATPQADPAYLTIDPAWVEQEHRHDGRAAAGHDHLSPEADPDGPRGARGHHRRGLDVGDQGVLGMLGLSHGRRGARRRRPRTTRTAPRSTSTRRRTPTGRSPR